MFGPAGAVFPVPAVPVQYTLVYIELQFLFRRGLCIACIIPQDRLDIPLELASRAHDLMPAAAAAKTEIRADAQHLPLAAPARVRFLHFQTVADSDIHFIPP